MNQMTRTLAFVIAASASVIGAVVAHVVTRPPAVEGYSDIGQPFYPDFTDPTKATAIRVAAWNPRTSRVEEFEVRQENGQWRIPSHYNYPADAQEQLAKAAASAVGILRGSLVSESSDTHERFGVVDPLDSSALQGAGQTGTRITLFQGDQVLADFIIGKRQGQADESPEETASANEDGSGKQQKSGHFYVRRPDESRVYLADVKIDVSTRFRDWIKKDLLELTQFDLRKIVVNQYSIEIRGQDLVQVPGDVSELTRESSSDSWKLKGLDESKEKLKTGVVSAMARALDELQIVGIRKKPEPLVRFFRDGVLTDTLQIIQVVQDLQRNGFYFDGQHLYSSQGEVHAGTKDGVVYTLRFGEVFTGSDLEVEVGQQEAQAEAAEKENAKDNTDAGTSDSATTTPPAGESDGASQQSSSSGGGQESAGGQETGSEQNKESVGEKEKAGKRSRYVIVEATFDPSLLGPPPTEPVRPTPPEGVQPAPQPPAEGKDAPADPNAPKQPGNSSTPPGETKATPPAGTDGSPEAPPPVDNPCDDTPQTPTEPPSASADTPPAPAAQSPADAKPPPPPAGANDPAAPPATTAPPAANPDPAPAADAEATPRQKTPQELYEEALKKYEADLETYKTKKEDYDKRLKEGQKRVEELNKRFAEWYYVISADLFEDLRVSRAQLVEPVTPPAESQQTTPAATPDGSTPPSTTPSTEGQETRQPPERKETPETKETPPPSKASPAESKESPAESKDAPADTKGNPTETDSTSSTTPQAPAEKDSPPDSPATSGDGPDTPSSP